MSSIKLTESDLREKDTIVTSDVEHTSDPSTPHTLPLLFAMTSLKPDCSLALKLLLLVPESVIWNAADTTARVGAAVGVPLMQLPQSVQSVP